MKKSVEKEITCLVKKLPPDIKQKPSKLIKQGFFTNEKNGLRIRSIGDRFELTKKIPIKPNDFSRFEEITISLTKKEFQVLWKAVKKFTIKRRYYYPLKNNLIAEIDVFLGKMRGLILVEVEFPNKKLHRNFKKPEWFGKDVTQEKWVSAHFLAGKKYKDIVCHLNS